MFEACYIEQGEFSPLWRLIATGHDRKAIQAALTGFVDEAKDKDLTHYKVREVTEYPLEAAPVSEAFLV